MEMRNCKREKGGGAPGIERAKAQAALAPFDSALGLSTKMPELRCPGYR
jgi:hypothetical protein